MGPFFVKTWSYFEEKFKMTQKRKSKYFHFRSIGQGLESMTIFFRHLENTFLNVNKITQPWCNVTTKLKIC